MSVGKSIPRVDAYDKAAGRAKYTADLCPPRTLVARVKHAETGNGVVKSIDESKARAVDGVTAVFTCFDVPNRPFPTAGHPWSLDPGHQDVADRLLLTSRVRYYGDDIAVVVADNETAAGQALRLIEVEYEAYPVILDVDEAMAEGASQLHDAYPRNILAHTQIYRGDYQKAIQEPGLI